MNNIQVLRNGTTKNKITIANGHIEVRLQDGLSPQTEQWLILFSGMIVDDVAKGLSFNNTLRGKFYRHPEKKAIVIDLRARNKRLVKSYISSDYPLPSVPEGL